MIGKILGKGCQYLLIRLNTSHYSLSAIIACKRMRSGMLGDILRHMKNELMNPRSSWSHGNYSHWQPFVIEVQGSFRFFLSLTVNYNLSSWLFPGIEDGLNHTFSSGKGFAEFFNDSSSDMDFPISAEVGWDSPSGKQDMKLPFSSRTSCSLCQENTLVISRINKMWPECIHSLSKA